MIGAQLPWPGRGAARWQGKSAAGMRGANVWLEAKVGTQATTQRPEPHSASRDRKRCIQKGRGGGIQGATQGPAWHTLVVFDARGPIMVESEGVADL